LLICSLLTLISQFHQASVDYGLDELSLSLVKDN
jgi:hypothetical protein